MFHKIIPFLVIAFSPFTYAIDHFEYYMSLHLQFNIIEIKRLIQENQDKLPKNDYDEIMLHVEASNLLLNKYLEEDINLLNMH